MAEVYTKTGDAGETSLYSGERVAKDDLRVEAYGTADELQAVLGLARALAVREDVKGAVLALEQLLVQVMAELATMGGTARIGAGEVAALEQEIDRFQGLLAPGFSLVVPGGSAGSAALHVARTVARRFERMLVRLAAREDVPADMLAAANRLSDLCYVLARVEEECADGEPAL